MKNCKRCGTEVGIFSTYCNNCKKEIQEIEKQKQKDLEKLEQDKDEAIRTSTKDLVKQISNEVLAQITDEPVFSFSYIHHELLQFKKTDWGTLFKGIIIGGDAGEMLFGGSINSLVQYEGYLGILIVTNNKVIIKCIKSPFFSSDGNIDLDHIKLFHSHALNRQFQIEYEFNLVDSELSQTKLPVGYEHRIFDKSLEFFFNPSHINILYQPTNIYGITDFYKQFYNAKSKLVNEIKADDEKQKIERNNLLKNSIRELNEAISYLTQQFDTGRLSQNDFEISLTHLNDKKEIIETYSKLSVDKVNELFFLMETIDPDEVIVVEGNMIKEIAKEQLNMIKNTKARNRYKLLYDKELHVDYL